MTPKQSFSFAFLNGLCWCVLSLGFFYINGLPTDGWGICFALIFLFAHIFLFAIGLGGISYLFKFINPRFALLISLFTASLITIFFGLDLLVFSQYRFHISPAMLELFFGPAGREIFTFSLNMWLIAAASILAIIGLEIGIYFLAKRWQPQKRTMCLLLAGWGLAFLLYNALYAWGKFNLVPSIMSQRSTLPFANPLSANRRLRKLGFEPKKDPYALPSTGTLHYPISALQCQSPIPQFNVLIVLIESWRADSVTPQIMPQLTQWATHNNMLSFTNHLSGGNATEAGVFSLFYSLPYAYWNDFTSRQLPPVLVTQALQTGYTPAIYASGKLNSPTFHQNIFATIPNLRLESQGNTKWQRDIDAVQDFEQFLKTHPTGQPFFGFIFLDATHGSSYPAQDEVFTPAQEMNYLLVNKNTDPTPYMNAYKNSVHFVDRMIGRILTDLQTKGLLHNTWIFITADHGQEINDTRHNFWGHNSNFSDYQTHVPLLVWDPTSTQKRTFSYRTSHYDIVPTVLQQLYGCTNPTEDYAIGKNLFDATPRPFTLISSYTKKAIRTEDQLTVLDQYGGIERYDAHFVPSTTGANPAAIKPALNTFAQFYR